MYRVPKTRCILGNIIRQKDFGKLFWPSFFGTLKGPSNSKRFDFTSLVKCMRRWSIIEFALISNSLLQSLNQEKVVFLGKLSSTLYFQSDFTFRHMWPVLKLTKDKCAYSEFKVDGKICPIQKCFSRSHLQVLILDATKTATNLLWNVERAIKLSIPLQGKLYLLDSKWWMC